MSDKINKSSVLSSLFWKFMERGGSQGIQFVMQIILARLLFPEDYGIIALVTIFISLASVFVQSGLNTALIQKKNADEVDFSSVFYLNLSLAVLFYTLLFFASPSIANFYRQPELKLVLRVLSLTLFFGAFNSIQISFVARNMLFKKQFFSTLGAVFVSGIVGITAAYRGARGMGTGDTTIDKTSNAYTVIMAFSKMETSFGIFNQARKGSLFVWMEITRFRTVKYDLYGHQNINNREDTQSRGFGIL